jgi:succinyl-diaminopimelate desuccinylase
VTGQGLSPAVAAERDHEPVIALTRELVRIPSRGGEDDYEPIVTAMRDWLGAAGLDPVVLRDESARTVGVTCEVVGRYSGPQYVLDACLDTAPFGDQAAWQHPPTAAVVDAGWLYGRGSADSKVAVSVFAHLMARLRRDAEHLHGSVALLLDADEHTGGFGGVHAFINHRATTGAPLPAGVFIGYPGPDHVVIGGRGVLRIWLTITGPGGHSGASRPVPNPVDKAVALIAALRSLPLPSSGDPDFPVPASLTITQVTAGESFSVVPDLCRVGVDIRLVPGMDRDTVLKTLTDHIERVDCEWPQIPDTRVDVVTHWPPYRLAEDSALPAALLSGARLAGLLPRPKIAGPSNIGSYLAGLGIPATAGFGVTYDNLHAVDERVRLDTIPAVQASYHSALNALLTARA